MQVTETVVKTSTA